MFALSRNEPPILHRCVLAECVYTKAADGNADRDLHFDKSGESEQLGLDWRSLTALIDGWEGGTGRTILRLHFHVTLDKPCAK